MADPIGNAPDRTADKAADKRREAQLRRLAASMGLALRKSCARDTGRMDYGCFRIVDAKTGYVLAGTYPYSYSLTLDGVEDALQEMLANSEERLVNTRPGTALSPGDAKWDR